MLRRPKFLWLTSGIGGRGSVWAFLSALSGPTQAADKNVRAPVREQPGMPADSRDIPEREPLDAAGRAYLRKLKRHAFLNGINLICVSTHQTFVSPKREEIDKNVEHTNKCIEIAHELGAPCIRINTGRWGTTKDF